jgi:hypothetical protein
LHFHCFNYHDALASFNLIIFEYERAHNTPGHGGDDLYGALFVPRSFLSRAQRAWIAQLHREALVSDPQMNIRRSLLAFDFSFNFIRASIDYERENIAAGEKRVNIDGAAITIQAARPAGGGLFELQP